MNKIFTVFKYELKNTLKSKTFLISTSIFVSIVIIGSILFRFGFTDMNNNISESISEYFPSELETESKEKIGVIIQGNDLDFNTIKEIYEKDEIISFENEEKLKDSVSNNEINAGLIFNNGQKLKLILDKAPTFGLGMDRYSGVLREYLIDQKLQEKGITFDEVRKIENSISISTEIETLKGNTAIATGIGSILSMIIYIMILMNGQIASMNVAREKNDRTMELLITSTNPKNLIHGKVMASFVQSMVTLLAVGIAAVVGLIINKDSINNILETLSAYNVTLDPMVIIIFLAFFIVGYILYLYIYAALGATVSNTEEINTALGPIMVIVVIVYLATVFAFSNPNPDNMVLKILSFVPFSSMFVIHTRFAITDMSLMEVGISFGILVITTLILAATSVKIYRSSSLNYGNRGKLTNRLGRIFRRK